ncbi:MAG: tetratricopeptide repeat protein [Pseudomonadota bacterium]
MIRSINALTGMVLGLALVQTPALADEAGLSGAYLAANSAAAVNDYREAARYYAQALARDPEKPELLENAIVSLVALGELERAVPLAEKLFDQGTNSQIAALVRLADRIGDADTVPDNPDNLSAVGDLVNGLAIAWALIEQGRMSSALEAFDAIVAQQGLKEFGLYNKALALALVGDFEGADDILSAREAGPLGLTRRGIIGRAQILSQLDRAPEALALIAETYPNQDEPALNALAARIRTGDAVPFDLVSSARDGHAEVFYTLAVAVRGGAEDGLTLIYSRIAEFLKPNHIDAVLLSAVLLEGLGQYDLATRAYDRVPLDHPAYHSAEIGRAGALIASGEVDAAIEALRRLGKSHGSIPLVHVSLGDALRRLERYDEASAAYDRALALIDDPAPEHWVLYYARGITFEREGKWDKAEADFHKALELRPNQPLVLNYLGYSYVERGVKLDEALRMIETAVTERPNDGYITDSLGWALYRLGRVEEAVAPMEKAVELTPLDPVINDHLGDVYWSVGRIREAEFQWRRALSFEPTEENAERIRKKLTLGLDAVLDAEAEDAKIKLAEDG